MEKREERSSDLEESEGAEHEAHDARATDEQRAVLFVPNSLGRGLSDVLGKQPFVAHVTV